MQLSRATANASMLGSWGHTVAKIYLDELCQGRGCMPPRSFFTGGNETNEGKASSLSATANRGPTLFVAFVIFCNKRVGGQGLHAPRGFFTGGNEANEGKASSLSATPNRGPTLFVAFVIFCKKRVGGQGLHAPRGFLISNTAATKTVRHVCGLQSGSPPTRGGVCNFRTSTNCLECGH
jgi:hypothetical protein